MATPGMEGGQPSISGMFAGASQVEVAGSEDFQREEQSTECPEPPEVLEIPGNELKSLQGKKKRPGEPYALSPSIQHFCPDSLAWLPSREGLSARPSLPAFGPKKSTWSGGVGGGGLVGGRGEKKHNNPSFVHVL